ncbi:hypothetical protein SAMN02910371_03728 [Butyrivibrio sp. INlla14]|nr:hypothetical protein SAMN02910371_03728 [Butyrivibrio sp. INlla14]
MNIYDFAKRVESLYEKAESVSDYEFENPNNGNVFRSYLSVMETLHEFVQDRTNLEILEKHFQKYDIVNITLHLLLVHPVTCFIMQPLPMNHSISFS